MVPEESIIVTVVLVCHNDGKWLPACIESLKKQTLFDRLELIIADNASEDGTDAIARDLVQGWPNARVLPTGGDNGFAYACNRGAEQARGKYVYLLSPDTWLEPDCLEQFVTATQAGGAAGAGGTILEYDSDDIQARGSHGFDFCGNPVSPPHTAPLDPLFCIAGFSFLDREQFLYLGKLDERLFMYCEEIDLAWRIWLSGRRLVHAPLARVHHRGAVLVNPAGGTRPIENRTSVQKRFLANRNGLVVIAKNCRHLLLLMLLSFTALIMAEFLATWLMTRRWSVAKATCLDSIAAAWSLRGHIREQRRLVGSLRRHGDFWMLRFLRLLEFGRSHELKSILRKGFPRISG